MSRPDVIVTGAGIVGPSPELALQTRGMARAVAGSNVAAHGFAPK
ncbi:hypothetical protein [Paracoccus sp. SCSIO 75233]|nr:hypothetical protein [Paracoccus sp. SCSIO 75233]WBU52850.1 hypothetical protein PAF12_13670 [Paracoccus sp. SCSIO 75233]